jgi:hypothetical protein
MNPFNAQNGIFRTLQIELRQPGGEWKRIRGDEIMSRFLKPGVPYELRVLNPELTLGLGIEGDQVMTPTQYLPLSD